METLGKYRIEERIGVGGFGEVFKAYDPFIKRHVAVKTCNADDEEIKSRFFQEAEIAGNLHHRNVITVYDFGLHEGLPYLIQEYLSGEDLDAKIKRRDFLPYPEKLYYLLQIARGLAYAHRKGVIHRDIKPANIRILEDGTARIMDFGIAKLAQQESGLTQTGMTLGTAAYLAPEQVRGESVDHRTDIFSFGVLAYELLTYERPFQGAQISTVLYNLLNQQPKPIPELWPEAPAELTTIIDRCLAKQADERYADGSALVRQLETLQKQGRSTRNAPAPVDEAPTPTVAYGAATPAAKADAAPATPTDHTAQTSALPKTKKLDELEVRSSVGATGTAQVPIAVQSSPSFWAGRGVRAALLVIATAAAAAGGWWFGMRDEPATGTTDGAAVTEEVAPAAKDPDTEPSEAPLTSTASPPNEPTSAEVTAESVPEVPPPSPPPAQEAPPEPQLGKLVLPGIGWTDDMTVRIGSRTYSLLRQRTVELKPGKYDAVFELDADGYSPPPVTVPFHLQIGGQHRLEIPIAPPAYLSVRPLPGKPQGDVLIDGQAFGSTPQFRRPHPPGSYVIEIRARGTAEPGTGGLTRDAVLESGKETFVTFDLAAGEATTTTKDLSP